MSHATTTFRRRIEERTTEVSTRSWGAERIVSGPHGSVPR